MLKEVARFADDHTKPERERREMWVAPLANGRLESAEPTGSSKQHHPFEVVTYLYPTVRMPAQQCERRQDALLACSVVWTIDM